MIYLGIDLGGTKVSGALFLENNSLLLHETPLLEGREGKEVAGLVTELCKILLSKGEVPETLYTIHQTLICRQFFLIIKSYLNPGDVQFGISNHNHPKTAFHNSPGIVEIGVIAR